MALVVKSNIKGMVKELQKGKDEAVTSVSDEVGVALERRVENILSDAIERAKANKRRTLQGRDL